MLTVFFMISLSLFAMPAAAQSMPLAPSKVSRIFIQPITGAGRPEDKGFFYEHLEYEVIFQKHQLAKRQSRSDYILSGKIEIFTGVEQIRHINFASGVAPSNVPQRPSPNIRNTSRRREYFSWEAVTGGHQPEGDIIYFYDSTDEDNDLRPFTMAGNEDLQPAQGKHIFSLELINRKTKAVIDRQYILFFGTNESMSELMSIITFNMLLILSSDGTPQGERRVQPQSVPTGGSKREKKPYGALDSWLFFESNLLWSPQFDYSGGDTLDWDFDPDDFNWVNIGVGLTLEFHFLRFMALEIGAQFLQDTSGGVENRDLIAEFPAALKLVFKPFHLMMIEPYGGVSYSLSLLETTTPSALSYFAGLQFGFKAGSGLFVIDPRVSLDFSHTQLGAIEAKRYMAQIGIGYKTGLFRKRN